ncbi:hypothetical protein Tco_0994982 [Tanacetum coccineum]
MRTPQQNDVVKRQNRTLVEADQIMMIFSKALMVLWAEVIFLDYRVTLGYGSMGGLDLACPIIRLSSQYEIHQELFQRELIICIDMEDDVDISLLTMEQYIALIPDDIKPGIVIPKIGDDVEFEINANFMRELRRKNFAGTDDEDAYEHVCTNKWGPYRIRETVRMIGNPEEIHNAKAQEDERDMDVGWNITSKDRLRQFLTPTIHILPNLEPVVQPYIPLGPVHDKEKIVREKEQDYNIPLNNSVMQTFTHHSVRITPPDDNYVAPATNPMSNKQLNKFKEEFSNKVAKKENDNPVIMTYDCETFIRKLLHQDPAARKHLSRSARRKWTLWVCSLEALTRLNSSTWATKWFNRLVVYAKCNRDSYKRDKELAGRRR